MQNNDLFLILSPLYFDTSTDFVDDFNPVFRFWGFFLINIIYLLKLSMLLCQLSGKEIKSIKKSCQICKGRVISEVIKHRLIPSWLSVKKHFWEPESDLNNGNLTCTIKMREFQEGMDPCFPALLHCQNSWESSTDLYCWFWA